MRECIDRHIDPEILRRVQLVEKNERATLLQYARSMTEEEEPAA